MTRFAGLGVGVLFSLGLVMRVGAHQRFGLAAKGRRMKYRQAKKLDNALKRGVHIPAVGRDTWVSAWRRLWQEWKRRPWTDGRIKPPKGREVVCEMGNGEFCVASFDGDVYRPSEGDEGRAAGHHVRRWK